jgi:hypothetical protein
MSTKLKKTIDKQINAVDLAITNALRIEAIKTVLATKGYTQQELENGLTLVESARGAVATHADADGDQMEATKAEKTARKIAEKAYQDLVKTVKAEFPNDESKLIALGVTGPMPEATDAFIKSANTLFDNAMTNNDIKDKISKRGYDDQKLKEEKLKITDYAQANSTQNSLIGAAVQATKDQETALATMNAWYAQFKGHAKLALTKTQQRALRLIPRTHRTKAQIQAPKKAAVTKAAHKAKPQ